MTIVGLGLFAVAAAIVTAAWIFHRDVVRVYYPRTERWQRDVDHVRNGMAQAQPLHEIEDDLDMLDHVEDFR